MAGVKAKVNSGEVALLAATLKTVLQIKAPANQRLMVTGYYLYGKGIVVTDTPMLFNLKSNAANFGTGTSVTPSKGNTSDDETLQSTAFKNFTVEPTTPTDRGIGGEC